MNDPQKTYRKFKKKKKNIKLHSNSTITFISTWTYQSHYSALFHKTLMLNQSGRVTWPTLPTYTTWSAILLVQHELRLDHGWPKFIQLKFMKWTYFLSGVSAYLLHIMRLDFSVFQVWNRRWWNEENDFQSLVWGSAEEENWHRLVGVLCKNYLQGKYFFLVLIRSKQTWICVSTTMC